MARHQVVCINSGPSQHGNHSHITHLGLGAASGYQLRITVAEAINQLRSPWGDRYFTISPTTGISAEVVEGECEACGQRPYVRTTADGIHDNNLCALRFCTV